MMICDTHFPPQATNNQDIWPRIRTFQSKLNNFFGKF